jgi:negative regulator of sigma E activity
MEEPTGRVTINMLYAKQLENEKLLIELSERLSSMEQIPSRVRELELAQAKTAWIEKVAYVALTAGVGAIVAAVMQVM